MRCNLLLASAITIAVVLIGCSNNSRTADPEGRVSSEHGLSSSLPADVVFGDAQGCANLFVYRLDSTGTWSVSVWLYAVDLHLSRDTISFAIPAFSDRQNLMRIEVLQFSERVRWYFCNDIGTDERPVRRWKAVAGTLRASISRDPLPSNQDHSYTTTIILEDVEFAPEDMGESFTLERIEFTDVDVGYRPG